MRVTICAWMVVVALGFAASDAIAQKADVADDEIERVQEAAEVINEIMATPDKGIPRDLLSNAYCVAIVPSMKEGAFIVGAKYGKGVMTCRGENRTGWTGPSTIKVEGGSVGFQIGGSATDVVMLVMNKEGAEKLMKSEFTLGGEAKVAAGPVGRSAKADTDAKMDAQILSYSRAKGVFAGVALDGATLRSDDTDNERLYGRKVTHEAILTGKVKAPASTRILEDTLNKYSATEQQ